jgi:hypothetical protein
MSASRQTVKVRLQSLSTTLRELETVQYNHTSRNLRTLGKRDPTIAPYVQNLAGVVVPDDATPASFPPTSLYRALERAPPLADRPPLSFEPLSDATLDAAFKLEIGGLTAAQRQAYEQKKKAESSSTMSAQEKALKKEKKEKKKAQKELQGGSATKKPKAESATSP